MAGRKEQKIEVFNPTTGRVEKLPVFDPGATNPRLKDEVTFTPGELGWLENTHYHSGGLYKVFLLVFLAIKNMLGIPFEGIVKAK